MEKLNFEQFKSDVHRTLISKLDLEKMAGVQNSKARQAVASLVQNIISDGKLPLSAAEKERVQSAGCDEKRNAGRKDPTAPSTWPEHRPFSKRSSPIARPSPAQRSARPQLR